MRLRPGKLIGEYRILEVIGSGGFSVVYKGEDTNLLRPVAIKQLSPEAFSEAGTREWFVREARLAARLDHPNIVATYALRDQGDDIFLIMEYLPGGDLHSLVAEKGPLDRTTFLRVATDMCHALEALHAQGVIHRDIKPENILIAHDGKFKLTDFGLAHIHQMRQHGLNSASGPQPGTLFYMSPEQAMGGHVTARSDVYSLAVVLYEAMTGHYYLPYYQEAQDDRDLMRLITQTPPIPIRRFHPTMPAAISDPLMRALSKNPAHRPGSAREFLSDIKNAFSRSRHTTLSQVHQQLSAQPTIASPELLRELYAVRTVRDAQQQPAVAQQRLHQIWETFHGVPEVAAEWGETLVALGNAAEGRDWLERALRLKPAMPFAQLALADLYRDVYDNTEAANDAMVLAIQVDSDLVYAVLYEDMVRSLDDLEVYESYVTLFKRAADEHPLASIYHNLGQVLALGNGREDESMAVYRRAIVLDPKYGPAYVGLGSLLMELDRVPDAITLLEEATRSLFPILSPEDWHKTATVYQLPHAYQSLAVAYAQLGDLEKSANAARTVLEMAPAELEEDAPELLDVYARAVERWIKRGEFQRAYFLLNLILPLAHRWRKEEVFSLMERLQNDEPARSKLDKRLVGDGKRSQRIEAWMGESRRAQPVLAQRHK